MNARLFAVLEPLSRSHIDISNRVAGQGSIRHAYEMFTKSLASGTTPHVMRHTAATLMLRAGVSLWDTAGVLGDTVATVEKYYGHHAAAHLSSAVGVLGRAASPLGAPTP